MGLQMCAALRLWLIPCEMTPHCAGIFLWGGNDKSPTCPSPVFTGLLMSSEQYKCKTAISEILSVRGNRASFICIREMLPFLNFKANAERPTSCHWNYWICRSGLHLQLKINASEAKEEHSKAKSRPFSFFSDRFMLQSWLINMIW